MIINKNEDIYYEVALFINKLILDNKLITYKIYKVTEDMILKRENKN